MKRRSVWAVLFATLFLLFSASTAEKADIEARFSITLLVGDECLGQEVGSDYIIGAEPVAGRSPLQGLLGITDYEKDLGRLEEALARYPEGFFEKFASDEAPSGLRILLAPSVSDADRGGQYGGLTLLAEQMYDVILSVNQFTEESIHHEIWHAVELRVTADDPDAFADWNSLNPEGFSYSNDFYAGDSWKYREQLTDDPDAWFVNGYSLVSEYEDRANIAAMAFLKPADWWGVREHLLDKLQEINSRAREIFGEVYLNAAIER